MKLRTLAATAAALGLGAVPLFTVHVDAGPVAVSAITVLNDPDYTDVDEENANIIDDLEAGGHAVTTVDDVDDLADALPTTEVLVIPELSDSRDKVAAAGFESDIDPADAAAIAAWVDGGGRIVFVGSHDPTETINGLFGFALEQIYTFCDNAPSGSRTTGDNGGVSAAAAGDPCLLTADAVSTEFADGPATLSYVDDSTTLDPASLPAGSTTAYRGTVETVDEEAAPAAVATVDAVVSMPYGDGAVLYYGWDWFPDTDGGAGSAGVAEEAEWAQVLDLGVSQPEVTAAEASNGDIVFTSDSPSTQPVFVAVTINGVAQTLTIAPKTTTVTVTPAAEATSASFTVPGWGIGEGSFAIQGITAPGPRPIVANPSFTG